MKLLVPFLPQQLLFAAGCALLLGLEANAQDFIFLDDGSQQQVKVIGMSATGSTLEYYVGQGKFGLPVRRLREVRMTPPPEYAQALQAYDAKDFPKALKLLTIVTDRFKGMPSPWAQQATGMLGDLYIALDDLAKAEEAYNEFRKLYPVGGSLQSEVGLLRLAVAKKDYATAKTKLPPIMEAALKEKTVPPAYALAFSQAFLVSGEVKQAEGNLAGALEDYLRTVTIFYHDRAAVSAAQDRADALRKEHPEITVP